MYRKEYPRAQWVRKDWLNLNGTWDFCFDDENEYDLNSVCFDKKIEVPFAYQTPLSGIHDTACHDVIWYKREFEVPSEWNGKNIILNFGAVDYRCDVYVNNYYVGSHEGGQTAFSFDITKYVNQEKETLVLRVEDPSYDEMIPRGKQTWEASARSIWYTRTSGIWQTVFIEPVDDSSIISVKYTPNIDMLSN